MQSLSCGVVINLSPPTLCGQPAFFRYSGLVPLKHNESQAIAIRLRGRVVIDECMEHTRQTFIRMEPALRDHSATMRCLVQTRLTIRCEYCSSRFRFDPLPPTLTKMPGKYCPNCGSHAITTMDPTLDYWELIAKSLFPEDETPPVQLTQTIYSLWMKDRTSTGKFVDYVREIQQGLNDA